MINKKEIINLLNSHELSLDLLANLLNCDESKLKEVLDEMVANNEIKYSKNLELYKVSKNKMKLKASPNDIYDFIITNNTYDSFVISKAFKIKYKELDALLHELVSNGKLVHDRQYDIYAPLYEATIDIKEAGYAFAYVESLDKTYYIYKNNLKDAYSGDTCLIYPNGYQEAKEEAVIHKVIKRGHTELIGRVFAKGKKYPKYKIESTMTNFNAIADVDVSNLNGACVGDIVVADIKYTSYRIIASVKQVLGNSNDPGIEISQIALEYGFVSEFNEDVEKEIAGISDIVLENQKNGRVDFTDLDIITIDGDDSKDFDDAVSVKVLENGNYELGVYIADVSEYVKESLPLDNEALKRGTSVYLADRVIPMLPYKLSNGICSLNEGVDRLVLACIMEIDLKGRLVGYDICEGVIKSKYRMTYKNVNKILEGDSVLIEKYCDIIEMLHNMKDLSKIIRELRFKKGGIEFDTEEYKFTLNADGSPKDIIVRDRGVSERIIEDFMLAANETVAYHMSIMNLPAVYRVHEKPDQEKLHSVFQSLKMMNVTIKNIQNDIHSKEIQRVLKDVEDNPNKAIINDMLLRSMMKAKYSEHCDGHYGLAMNYYCHFTSPIRRYPDLMTHRMIKKLYLHPNKLEFDITRYNEIIPKVADLNSISERKAVDCERAVNDMLFAWYMSRNLYKNYTGIITSMTNFGMFITLDNGAEGLLAYRNMNGYFDYNEMTMTASNGRKTYKLGDKVEIVVANANKETRKIDFLLKEDYSEDDRREGYLY